MSDEGVQVTLEMIGDELLKRVIAEIHGNLQNHFAINVIAGSVAGYGHHQTSQVQPTVGLTVELVSRHSGIKIQSQQIFLKVLPDAWGKPYLST